MKIIYNKEYASNQWTNEDDKYYDFNQDEYEEPETESEYVHFEDYE